MQKNKRMQAAMESLLTYGWAILIMAVVLGILYSLGVFNSVNFAPRAPPGSCAVSRSGGPGTTNFINLQGTCLNEMPKYVAQFNGASSYITTPISGSSSSFTVSLWFEAKSSAEQFFFSNGAFASHFIAMGIASGYMCNDASGSCIAGQPAVSTGIWYNYIITYNGVALNSYLNSVPSGPITTTLSPLATGAYIGAFSPSTFFTNGYVADVQIYNTSLSQQEVVALYQEGIGGAPQRLNNIVGWWPLNNNPNDYSGNLNNGQSTNVVYTAGWTNSYTPP
jgi:hypothetical protein